MTASVRLKLIAFELTRRCRLKCRHCRAEAAARPQAGELSTGEIKKTLENISSFAKPVIILTGGEPMMRDDVFEIASYGDSLGLRMTMATCGHLVTREAAERMKDARIRRLSISIDGAARESHDLFRGAAGSFDDAVSAARNASGAGLSFQINTTVTKENRAELPRILSLAEELGADAFHPFLLVPVGRGRELAGLELSPQEYEEALNWIYAASKKTRMAVKPTCAPHYARIAYGRAAAPGDGMDGMSRGCLGGSGFAFISHTGDVQICGFLDIKCGSVRENNFNFNEIWETSKVFNELRDRRNYKGKCGICEYFDQCGGCRARAHAKTGDYLASEPFCVHIPGIQSDAGLLSALQEGIPLVLRPFREMAARLGTGEDELVAKIADWMRGGLIRYIAARIDAEALGFKSALVALSAADVAKAARAVAAHPGVSHNYERDHEYNIWFTIRCPRGMDIEKAVDGIASAADARDFLILPAKKVFKLDARFDLGKGAGRSFSRLGYRLNSIHPAGRVGEGGIHHHPSPADLVILEKLNLGIPIAPNPFKEIADEAGMTEEETCGRAQMLRSVGLIRSFRAVVHHVKAGLRANAMVVWDAPDGRVDEIGERFAGRAFVSHCYERVRHGRFPYNLYAMIHADSDAALNVCIGELAGLSGIGTCIVLRTKCELMKRRTTILAHPP